MIQIKQKEHTVFLMRALGLLFLLIVLAFMLLSCQEKESTSNNTTQTTTTEAPNQFDENGNPIREEQEHRDENGNITQVEIRRYQYDENGNLIYNCVATEDEEGNSKAFVHYYYTYQDGKLIKHSVVYCNETDTPYASRFESYTYDEDRVKTSATVLNLKNDVIIDQVTYQYDKNGRERQYTATTYLDGELIAKRVTVTLDDSNLPLSTLHYEYRYNEDKQRIEELFYEYGEQDHLLKTIHTTRRYNENKALTEITTRRLIPGDLIDSIVVRHYQGEDNFLGKNQTDYTYNENHTLLNVKYSEYDKNESRTSLLVTNYNEKGIDTDILKFCYTYTEDGRLDKIVEMPLKQTHNYYDENQKLIRTYVFTYEYNENHTHKTKLSMEYDGDGHFAGKVLWEYVQDDKLRISCQTETRYDHSDTEFEKNVTSYEYTDTDLIEKETTLYYSIDNTYLGKVIYRYFYDESGNKLDSETITKRYDKNGRLLS